MAFIRNYRICAKLCIIFLATLIFSLLIYADSYSIIFHVGKNRIAVPVDSINCVYVNDSGLITTILTDSNYIVLSDIDSVSIEPINDDTIKIHYDTNSVIIFNPRADFADIITNENNADVEINIKDKGISPFIELSGTSQDGRLKIDSDIDYTLILNEINLKSNHAPAINSINKQKVTVMIKNGTENYLCDSENYSFSDTIESANGCFNALGPISFKGHGLLSINGLYKHGIYSKKSISFSDGTYKISNTESDAIHSGKNVTINGGKFELKKLKGDAIDLDDDLIINDGYINMEISGLGAKGIKCGGVININGGKIDGLATGSLDNVDGDLSYCTLIKCDSDCYLGEGCDLNLINSSPGGKCISTKYNLYINGSTLQLKTTGNGAEYINNKGEKDYYTSKCISTEDSLFLNYGEITCNSFGLGGKGIVSDKYMSVGLVNDTIGPIIHVTTSGNCIINDVDEDLRFGCPKAIKVDSVLNIYCGSLYLKTDSMGGEGIECNDSMYVYGGKIDSRAYDDGINVGNSLIINGGDIYCSSANNDGIDSNGSLNINGGYTFSISEHKSDESFDSEKGQFHINGGTVIGLCSSYIHLGNSKQPVYNEHNCSNYTIEKGNDYYIKDLAGKSLLNFTSQSKVKNCILLISSPIFTSGDIYLFEDKFENILELITVY